MVFQTVGDWASHEPEQHQDIVSHEMSSLKGKPFVYGSLASIVAEFGTFPVDLPKMQLQDQSIDVHFKEKKY